MINEIKLRGFEKYRTEIEEKIKEKKKYEMIIEKLQKQLGVSNKHCCVHETKHIQEMNLMQNSCERNRRQIFFMSKELPLVKKEIEEMNSQYDIKQKETTQIGIINSEEEKQVKLIQDDIRKTNRKISEIQKEKEQTRSAIMLLKKHVEQLKNKINIENSKSKEFMLNVSKLTRSVISET